MPSSVIVSHWNYTFMICQPHECTEELYKVKQYGTGRISVSHLNWATYVQHCYVNTRMLVQCLPGPPIPCMLILHALAAVLRMLSLERPFPCLKWDLLFSRRAQGCFPRNWHLSKILDVCNIQWICSFLLLVSHLNQLKLQSCTHWFGSQVPLSNMNFASCLGLLLLQWHTFYIGHTLFSRQPNRQV